jgi:hypothetical protein
MFNQFRFRREGVSQFLGIFAVITGSLACGCASGNGHGGGTGGLPSLAASVASVGNFSSGQQGATYTINVSNTGTAPTSGTVSVADPPTGFTVTGIAGPLWTCTLATTTCTNSNPQQIGQSFPTITVTGNVTAANGAAVTIPVVLSGGGAATINVTPTPSIPVAAFTCPLAPLGNESLLSGTYIASLNGWEDGMGPFETAGAFVTNGAGGVTNGEMDSGAVVVGTVQSAPLMETISGGCYQLGPDQRGLIVWNLSGGAGSVTLAFSLGAGGQSGHIIEFDDANPGTGPGKRSAGTFFSQTGGPFTLANFSGPFAFYTKGAAPNGTNTDYLREGTVGRFDESTTGVVTNGTVNLASATGTGAQTNIDNQIFTGSLTAPDTLGRGTATFTYANFNGTGPLTLNFAYYIQDANDLLVQSIDTPDNKGHGLKHGAINTQANGPYSLGALNGNAVFYMFGADLRASHSFTVNSAGQIAGDGLGGANVKLDEVSDGSIIAAGTNTIPGGSFAVSPSGMGVLTIGTGAGAKSFSVAMYDQNAGVLLEGTAASPGSNVLIGAFESQTIPAGGYVDGILSGLYVLGTHLTASSYTNFDVGSVMTPTPQTSPAGFSGKTDHINGAGCTTACISSNQAVSANYSIDANGRITMILTSGAGGTAVGWFVVKNGNRFFFISDTGNANATILSANH